MKFIGLRKLRNTVVWLRPPIKTLDTKELTQVGHGDQPFSTLGPGHRHPESGYSTFAIDSA